MAQTRVLAALDLVYTDVLQREPTAQEVQGEVTLDLLRLPGIVRLYERLLCSAEYFSRFVVTQTPLVTARVLICHILGRNPSSQDEIEVLAVGFLSRGWLPFIKELLAAPSLHERIQSEIAYRLEAQRPELPPRPEPKPPTGATARGVVPTRTIEPKPAPPVGRHDREAGPVAKSKPPARAKSSLTRRAPAHLG